MNYLWGGMILIGIIYAAFHGTLPDVTEAALSSAKEAVSLCITITGIMSFWVGIMRIAEKSGMIEGAAKRMKPILRFLFPSIPENHQSLKYIATNFIANIFGLGWAATPAGLKAMEELGKLEEERRREEVHSGPTGKFKRRGASEKGTASREMCTFLIINISSLQLIPVNIIAYRSQYGSVNPTAIVGPAIIATSLSTLIAILFCRIMDKSRK